MQGLLLVFSYDLLLPCTLRVALSHGGSDCAFVGIAGRSWVAAHEVIDELE